MNGKIVAEEEFPISGEMDGNHYQIDNFLEAVAKKYGVRPDDVKTYMMDEIDFNPKGLPLWCREACGSIRTENCSLLDLDETECAIQTVEDIGRTSA